jgi:integrase
MQKRSSKKAGRVVKRKLADGSVKVYRYQAYVKRPRDQDTIGDLIQAYNESPEWHALAEATKTVYAIYHRVLVPLGHLQVKNIKRRDLLRLRDAIATARGNGAANGFIRSISVLFGWALDREWIETNPAYRLKKLAAGHLPAWTPEQVATALRLLPPHLCRAVLLALYTGQRRGDLCRLAWTAYDGQTIRLVQQKTGAPLILPVHHELKRELDTWSREAVTILTDQHGLPWRPVNLSEQLPYALQKIGLPAGLNIHGLRKSAAANLADAGCSASEIAAVTGHKSLQMVALYTASADQERMAKAAIIRLSDTTAHKTQKNRRKP